MNHLRELLDTPIHRWLVPGSMIDDDCYALGDEVTRFGSRAVCFWLGEIEDVEGLKIIPELCRLPFRICWFELNATTSENIWQVGLLAVQIRVDDTACRLYGFRRSAGTWELRFTADSEQFVAGAMAVVPADHQSADEAMAATATVGAFLSALHCSNVRHEEHAPNPKLQKARAKRGKAPLFSYWTLQLDKRGDERGENMGGSHASPRVHLRRGHPRQYSPGKWTWVQAHAVGNRAAGMVHKDYSAGQSLVAQSIGARP